MVEVDPWCSIDDKGDHSAGGPPPELRPEDFQNQELDPVVFLGPGKGSIRPQDEQSGGEGIRGGGLGGPDSDRTEVNSGKTGSGIENVADVEFVQLHAPLRVAAGCQGSGGDAERYGFRISVPGVCDGDFDGGAGNHELSAQIEHCPSHRVPAHTGQRQVQGNALAKTTLLKHQSRMAAFSPASPQLQVAESCCVGGCGEFCGRRPSRPPPHPPGGE